MTPEVTTEAKLPITAETPVGQLEHVEPIVKPRSWLGRALIVTASSVAISGAATLAANILFNRKTVQRRLLLARGRKAIRRRGFARLLPRRTRIVRQTIFGRTIPVGFAFTSRTPFARRFTPRFRPVRRDTLTRVTTIRYLRPRRFTGLGGRC